MLDLMAGTDNVDERRELLAATSDGAKASFGDIFAKGEWYQLFASEPGLMLIAGVRGRTFLGIFLVCLTLFLIQT